MSTLVRVVVQPTDQESGQSVVEVVVHPDGYSPRADPRVTLGHPSSLPSLTPVLVYDGDHLISCCGHNTTPGMRKLEAVYAKVYLEEHPEFLLQPYNAPAGVQANGQIPVDTVIFYFFGSQHASGDGHKRLIKLAADAGENSIQWLYVWAKMSGNKWAEPKQVRMLLQLNVATESGDTEP